MCDSGRLEVCHVGYTKNRIFLFLVKELERPGKSLSSPRFGFSACCTLYERAGRPELSGKKHHVRATRRVEGLSWDFGGSLRGRRPHTRRTEFSPGRLQPLLNKVRADSITRIGRLLDRYSIFVSRAR